MRDIKTLKVMRDIKKLKFKVMQDIKILKFERD